MMLPNEIGISVILVQQLKERIAEGGIYYNCKNQSENSLFESSENLHFESFSPDPTMMGSMVGTRYCKNVQHIENLQ